MSTHTQKSGYQSQSRLSPAAIGGVLLVHAGLGAVILTMSVIPIKELPIPYLWTENIPAAKPKPPVAERDVPVRKTRASTTAPDVVLPRIAEAYPLDQQISPDTDGVTTDLVQNPDILPPPIEPLPPVLVQAKPDARFASGFQPPYPGAMLRQQMEGAVTVRVTIGPDGRVIDVAMVSAADPAFYEATRRQALSRWRFIPGTRDGVAITTVKVMTVHFRLTD